MSPLPCCGVGVAGLGVCSTVASAPVVALSSFFSAAVVMASILPVSRRPIRWNGEIMASQMLIGFSRICTTLASCMFPARSQNTPRLPTHRLPFEPEVTGRATSYFRPPFGGMISA